MPLHDHIKQHILKSLELSSYMFAYHESLNYILIFLYDRNINLLLCRIPNDLTIDPHNYYFIGVPYDDKAIIKIHELSEEKLFDEYNKRYISSPSLFIIKLDTLDSFRSIVYKFGLEESDNFFTDGALQYVFGT